MGSISHKVYKDQKEQKPTKAADDQNGQKTAQRSELINMNMHTSVDPQDTFEALANQLFGFSRAE